MTDHEGAAARRLESSGLVLGIAILLADAARRLDGTALWLDEAYSLGAANHLGASLRGTSGTMGLYYAFLSAWSTVSTATWWLRLPSVLFAVATLAVLRPIARRLGGPRLVALALPAAALGPLFASKATEARAYSLETLVVVSCWYVLLRALDADDGEDRRWFALLAPLAVAGGFCHGLFVVQLVPMGVIALLGRRPLRHAGLFLASVTPVGLAVLYLHANGAADIGTNVPGDVGVLVASTFEVILSRQVVPRLVLAQLLVVGVALAVRRTLRTTDRRERPMVAMAAAWAVLPCVALGLLRAFDPVYNPRYLAPVGPGVALVLSATALGIEDAWRRSNATAGTRARSRRIGPIGIAVVLLLAYVLASGAPFVDDDWRGTARLVAEHAREGDGIIFVNTSMKEAVQHRPPFEAAWNEVEHPIVPVAVSPPRPLAEVRRFDVPLPVAELAGAARDLDRLWLVESASGPGRVDALIAGSGLDDDYREADRWTLRPAITVVLLERR